uniref:Uncharacterized protein n=2 Tax=Arion vulgaris TaxID=1028688 RepID=A0A0B6ZWW3_9EUPU
MDTKSYLRVPGWESSIDRLGESCCSGSSTSWELDNSNNNDKYTAAIELSNKCREFYKHRLEAANKRKSKCRESSLGHQQENIIDTTFSSSSSSSPLTSDGDDNVRGNQSQEQRRRIDQAMDTLRSEMVSLMDQDLSLMKQLLTLNETIEDLKWQRQYYSYSNSWTSFSASKNMERSVSDMEIYDSDDEDFRIAQQASPCSSVQTAQVTGSTWHNSRNVRKNSRDFQKISVDSVNVKVESMSSSLRDKPTRTTDTKDILPVNSDTSTHFRTPSPQFTFDCHVISNGAVTIHHERGENSFDSGIHEATSSDELTWSS